MAPSTTLASRLAEKSESHSGTRCRIGRGLLLLTDADREAMRSAVRRGGMNARKLLEFIHSPANRDDLAGPWRDVTRANVDDHRYERCGCARRGLRELL